MNGNEGRPNPEELLEAVKREESERNKGRLKIFLGMSAGVGKTFSMLEEAQQLKQSGTDVLAGVVETHGRQETAKLLEELKIIPKKKIIYRDKELWEFDLDTLLAAKPQIALIDELAHSNIPGSRHNKRWQDVVEILDNGIDVYTTLNIQHIESLKDIVEGIAGVGVRETVPDLIIERASSIQLVDLTPEKLLQRLKEGKVYLGDQSRIASHNFFQKDRLTALREIVLRYTAEKVDRDLHGMVSAVERSHEWKTRERLLVLVSHSNHSKKMIRTTRRLASQLNAPWIALYINNGQYLTENENNQLAKNLALARDLGAVVITTNDLDFAEGIQRIVRQKGVTQVIVAKPTARPIFDFFHRDNLLDSLAKKCKDIDIHIVGQESIQEKYRTIWSESSCEQQAYSYAYILLIMGGLTGFNWFIEPFIGYKVVGAIYFASVLILSLFFSKGPIIFASLLFACAWGIFFIPPTGGFYIEAVEDRIMLGLYFLIAVATGILTDRGRQQKQMLAKREENIQALYGIVRQIVSAPSAKEIFKAVKERLDMLMNGTFEIILKQINNGLSQDELILFLNDEKERSTAIWAFENEKEAGWSTETLPSSKNLYIPLKGHQENVGLMTYAPRNNRTLTPEEKNFLHTVSQQLASHVERSFARERSLQHEQLKQLDKMHKTVLERISLEFQGPMVITTKAVKQLKTKLESIKERIDISEVYEIENSSEEINKILANISSLVQLSDGLLPLNKEMHKIQVLINDCCERFNEDSHKIQVGIQEGLPEIFCDSYLIEMTLYNLIGNAIYNSPPGSKITIDVKKANDYIVIAIADEGKGIPDEQLEFIFEKFFRIPEEASPGIGLGLAIAKTIAEIHNGYLKAENQLTKGAKFSLYLPIEETAAAKK